MGHSSSEFQVIIAFLRRILVDIKGDTTKEKEDAKMRVVKTIPADGSSSVSVFTDILASFEVAVEKETVENGFKVFVESDKGKDLFLENLFRVKIHSLIASFLK